jgi:hypothetical protein
LTNYTLLEKVFFFSFGFRSGTEKVSKILLFQAQIMICSWKKNIFDSKKKNILSTIMVLDLYLFFCVFVLRVYEMYYLKSAIFIFNFEIFRRRFSGFFICYTLNIVINNEVLDFNKLLNIYMLCFFKKKLFFIFFLMLGFHDFRNWKNYSKTNFF